MLNKDEVGRRGEQLAVDHLIAAGYRVLDRNWRCREGELDVVALDGDELVVVEVKTRTGLGYGHPFEAVDRDKLHRLGVLASRWRGAHRGVARSTRIDLIAVVLGRHVPPVIDHMRAVA
ncbi:YraN family protein [Amnibacterium endophyticum]|uniref:UPF0102 protein ACFSBI_09675 n=1 Tax=Amnibacterium endophyticum TaxID=2109337 RepID=A0ABW4LFA7_9MICO